MASHYRCFEVSISNSVYLRQRPAAPTLRTLEGDTEGDGEGVPDGNSVCVLVVSLSEVPEPPMVGSLLGDKRRSA